MGRNTVFAILVVLTVIFAVPFLVYSLLSQLTTLEARRRITSVASFFSVGLLLSRPGSG